MTHDVFSKLDPVLPNRSGCIVTKRYDAVYVLRVSGKGDAKGAKNQLDVLRSYSADADAAQFLRLFDSRMMKASDREGARLRREWQTKYDLTILSREGRRDFLGIKVAFGRSIFIVYASTAAQLDEDSGNAFTRHVCEAIADPAFNGQGDPEFMARRERGEFDVFKHPSTVYAFDPTRFVRSMDAANSLYTTAERWLVAFEAKDIHIDPQLGGHQRLMWSYLAFGSQMEAEVGKLRRFVGRLNMARSGQWPYRDGVAPLGAAVVTLPNGDRVLRPDEAQVEAVQTLVRLGLEPRVTDRAVLERLSRDHGIESRFPPKLGVPVEDLHPMAAHRFFVRRRLEGYRDGEYALTFVGVAQNQLRAGSGHHLSRRWDGLDAAGQPDRHGAITYRLPFPKPTVLGPDGQPRKGWLAGLTDEEETSAWNRLIAVRGRDDDGRRLTEQLPDDVWQALSEDDRERLRRARRRAVEDARGGREGTCAVSALVRPYRSDSAAAGLRTFIRVQRTADRPDAYCQLRVETVAPAHPDAGISRRPGHTRPVAAFRERELTRAVAELITGAVRVVMEQGATPARHDLTGPPDPTDEGDVVSARRRELHAAAERRQEALTVATGCDKYIALLLGGDAVVEDQLSALQRQSKVAWAEHAAASAHLAALEKVTTPEPVREVAPTLDLADPRDLVVALRGLYGAGQTPQLFIDALAATFPNGVRLQEGRDFLEWVAVGDVALQTTTGETVTVPDVSAPITNIAGRGAGGGADERLGAVLRRRLHDGLPLVAAAEAGAYSDLPGLRRSLTARLRASGRFPDHTMIQPALDCEVPDATLALWHHLIGEREPRSPFERHVLDVYTGALPSTTRTIRSAPAWAYDSNVDRRLEQLTIVTRAADMSHGVHATALASALDASNAHRNVLDASAPKKKVNATYPPALERVATPDLPEGWHGAAAMTIPVGVKRVSAMPCPWTDCASRHATALVPVLEVLALGAMVLCRQCRRAASPLMHPMREAAKSIRFPQGYLDWADAQVVRTGAVVRCAAACSRDVGFGPGRTWRWDDSLESRAWHDNECRSGEAAAVPTPCKFLECDTDEGAGAGLIVHAGRGRRRWHSKSCEHAEARRRRAQEVRFVACLNPDCTLDEGGGPGSIKKAGKHRTVHAEACRRASRPRPHMERVRAWARAHGHQVADRGRLPAVVVAAYAARDDADVSTPSSVLDDRADRSPGDDVR